MGYVPVQRDAGQIMYQGAMQRARTLGQTARDITDFLYQKDEENKAFGAKLKSLESLLQTHSDKFGIKENDLKQFLSVDPNESPRERYLRLGSFIEGTMKASDLEKQKQAAEAAKAETLLRGRQAAETQEQTRTRALQNLAMEQALREQGISVPQVAGGAAIPAQAAAAAQPMEPVTAAAPAPRRSIYDMPGQPPMSEEKRAYVQQQTAAAPAPATGAEAAAKFASPRAGTAAFQTPPGLDPEIYAAAKAEGLRSIAAGRGPIDVMAQYNKMVTAKKTERQEALKAQEQMTWAQASAKAEEYNKQYPERFYVPKANPDGATYSLEVTLRPKSAAVVAEEAGRTKLMEQRATAATTQLTEARKAAIAARDNLYRYDQMEAALLSGVRTGFGAEALSELTSAGVAAGIYPENQQAAQEVLFKQLAVDAFEKAQQYLKGQGSVSNPEREAIAKLSQSAKTNGKALIQLIRMNRQLALRQAAGDDYQMELEQKYANDPLMEMTVAKEMNRWWAQNPLGKFEAASRVPTTSRQTADDIYNTVMGGKR